MKSVSRLVTITLVCATFASCKPKGDTYATYTSGDGGFSVLLPVNPLKQDKTEVTPFGKQVVHYVSWKPSNFSINKIKEFQVSYTACPDRFITDSIMREVMLDSAVNMRKKDFTERDFPSEAIELNGYPGRAFIYDMPSNNTVAIVKECFVNSRKYDLMVVAKKDQGTNEEVSNFFNSFQVIR